MDMALNRTLSLFLKLMFVVKVISKSTFALINVLTHNLCNLACGFETGAKEAQLIKL